MNIRVGIGILSLIASISILQGRTATADATASTNEQAQASVGTTLTAIGADVTNIVTTATNLAQHHDKQTILASVGQFLNSIFSIVSTLVNKGDMQMEPMIIEVREALVNDLVNAIDCSREYLKQVSLSELGCALKDAEQEVAMCAARAQDGQVMAQEEIVKDVLKSLIHDLFAIIQSSGTNDNIGESIAQMLTNILEQATDTLKYEQLAAEDMDTCAAMYVDRVCAELTRQIRHLMVQSALTLRGSTCSVECCKNPSHPCAAAINMIMGTRKGCNSCCRPSARPCCSSCCNNTTCCVCNKSMPMDDEMEMRGSCNCGCKPNNCTCKPNCSSCKPSCGCNLMDMDMSMEMRGSCNCGCKPNCSSCKPNCGCSMMDMNMDDMEMRGSCGCKPNCNTCKPNCGCKMMDMDMDDAQMCKCSCGCNSRMMDCNEMTLRCPCNKPKPQPQTRPVAAQALMMAEQMMDPMAPAKRVIVKCPCNSANRPNYQNSPRPTTPPRQQVTPSRKDGHRVLPEGQAPMRRKDIH